MKNKLIFLSLIVVLVGLWRFVVVNADLDNEAEEKVETMSYMDLSAEEALDLLKGNSEVFLVDVHTPEQEHLAETDAFIPFNEVRDRLADFPEDKEAPILVYCRSGNMSETVSEELVENGYRNVYNLTGGIHAWQGAGLRIDWREVGTDSRIEGGE